ncbi:MAG: dienelactone hydrolase family protein [Chloroflexota bacterium]|nr:dienelactone hydrolase family protein [Chloroflexota bacterium]MDE2885164.1 dienelactone hydrolase family protein [Chloroflexota bacterium]
MAHRIVSLHAGYDGPNGFVDGYVGRPSDRGPYPGLVVVSGMGGLNWFQREITRTFARAGFVALSPDLFDGVLPQGHATQLRYKNSLDVQRTVENLSAGADFLRALPWTADDAPVGVVGFCLGGGLVLLSLARTNTFSAGVVYYHSLFPDPEELESIRAPMMCHYGTHDHTTPIEEIEAFRATLDRYEKQYELFMYEGVGHSFLNPRQDSSAQREEAATASLERTFAFFRNHLGAPAGQAEQSETPGES